MVYKNNVAYFWNPLKVNSNPNLNRFLYKFVKLPKAWLLRHYLVIEMT